MGGTKIGAEKGFPVEKLPKKVLPKHRKGAGSKSTKVRLVKEIVREVGGLLPYEKRIMDMIKTGGASAEKRIYKFAKKRLGTHTRALRKREDVKDCYAQIRARRAMEN